MNRHQHSACFDNMIRHSMGTNVIAATLVNTETARDRQIRQAADLLGFAHTTWLNQVHSGIVCMVDRSFRSGTDGDAMICRTPDMLLGVFTADCVPVLVRGKQEVGVIHAGWRGFAAHIFDRFFEQWETAPEHTSAFIGPCICSGCYEVGHEVADHFHPAERIEKPAHTPRLNLRLAARNRLMDSGILPVHIQDDMRCTACCPELHSYRQNKTSYRNLSVIGLTPDSDKR